MKTNFRNKNIIISILLFLLAGLSIADVAAKTVKEQLEEAKKAKKPVFLIVTGNGTKSEAITKVCRQAQQTIQNALIINLNRDDPANKEVVRELAVGSIALPMILVIGANGTASAGIKEAEATADKIIKLIPSPKKLEALGYLDKNKPVFILAYRKTFADRAAVVGNCKTAVSQLKGNAGIVEVDLDDPTELALLKQAGADFTIKKTQVLVFNAAGKSTGTFSGTTDPGKLVTAARSVPKSCCPNPGPGCGK